MKIFFTYILLYIHSSLTSHKYTLHINITAKQRIFGFAKSYIAFEFLKLYLIELVPLILFRIPPVLCSPQKYQIYPYTGNLLSITNLSNLYDLDVETQISQLSNFAYYMLHEFHDNL